MFDGQLSMQDEKRDSYKIKLMKQFKNILTFENITIKNKKVKKIKFD